MFVSPRWRAHDDAYLSPSDAAEGWSGGLSQWLAVDSGENVAGDEAPDAAGGRELDEEPRLHQFGDVNGRCAMADPRS